MDGERFDRLTRVLASATNRRQVLRGLLGGIAGVTTAGDLRSADAVICRNEGVLCAKDAQCCSNSCDTKIHKCVKVTSSGGPSTMPTVTAASASTLDRLVIAANRDQTVRLLTTTLSQDGYTSSANPAAINVTQNGNTRSILVHLYANVTTGAEALFVYDGGAVVLVASGGTLTAIWTVSGSNVQQQPTGAEIPVGGLHAIPAIALNLTCDQCTGSCGLFFDIHDALQDPVEYGAEVSVCLVAILAVCATQSVISLGTSDSASCALETYADCQQLEDLLTGIGAIEDLDCLVDCTEIGFCGHSTPSCDHTLCDKACIDTSSDPAHCGSCNQGCSSNNMASKTCTNGQCTGQCKTGYADCDHNKRTNGCETKLGTVENCIGCGDKCDDDNPCTTDTCDSSHGCQHPPVQDGTPCTAPDGSSGTCRNGQCGGSCPSGQIACSGHCVDTRSDPSNCGGCATSANDPHVCGADQVCSQSKCADAPCPHDHVICHGQCLTADALNNCCGSCGDGCAADEFCCEGTCVGTTAVSVKVPYCDSSGGYFSEWYAYCGGQCLRLQSNANGRLIDSANCGACGVTCEAPLTCCDGQCVDLQSDPNACGICGQGCSSGHCCNGQCSLTNCGGQCTDTQTDSNNCGMCGHVCDADDGCCFGTCVGQTAESVPAYPVPGGQYYIYEWVAYCGDQCLTLAHDANETLTDDANCGSCGAVCSGGTHCCGSGNCVDLQSDPSHCGFCEEDCGLGGSCIAGQCQATTPNVQVAPQVVNPTCPSGQLACNDSCIDPTGDANNCGACGHVCDSGSCTKSVCDEATAAPAESTAPSVESTGAPTCPDGQTLCDSGCVDTASDLANCGGCGNSCNDGESCVDSACTEQTPAGTPEA